MSNVIAIIGAGAAGCFAAANIPVQAGREVVVFEKTHKPLQKVKVSGGGRCNVTHACFEIPELIKRYPRGQSLLKKSLYHFSPEDTIRWFGERGVRIKQEQDGRMFPDTDDSQTIIDCIWQEMMRRKVQVRYGKQIVDVVREPDHFRLHFADGTDVKADKLLLAAGSILKAEQFQWLTRLGHPIEPPAPSLFTFNLPGNPITQLMGVSVPEVTVKIAATKFVQQGPLLVTHWGLSGPAVLRTSAWAARWLQEKHYDFTVLINWLNDVPEPDLRETFRQLRQQLGRQLVQHKNPFDLPKRLWEFLLLRCGIADTVRWGDLPAAAQNKLIASLVTDSYAVKGKTTFKEEFVTCGGVALAGINPQTMESRTVPGLYFAGEVMDVDGVTGGFNFQHAWCSGWIAAQQIAGS